MKNEEKIIAAIAAYLKNADWNYRLPGHVSAEKIAIEIAADVMTLSPAVEPKDYPFSELFDHMAGEYGIELTNAELLRIIHIARK